MIFSFEDSLKGLKKELKSAGMDVSFVKEWQKSYSTGPTAGSRIRLCLHQER